MIYGNIGNLFPVGADTFHCPSCVEELIGPNGDKEQFLSDLVMTFCEEPAYHYGFREEPGHNVGDGSDGIPYKYRFGNSCFLDVLSNLIKELGRDKVTAALLKRYAQDPDNMVIVHNLGVIFGVENIAMQLQQAHPFLQAWKALDKRPYWDRPRPAKIRLEQRLLGLSLAERLARMWEDQDDAKQYMRYLGTKLNGEELEDADYEELHCLLSEHYRKQDQLKVKRMARTFEQSKDEGFRILGKRLKEPEQ